MIYTLDNKKFELNYQKLKEQYSYFCGLSNSQFLMEIKEALHLSVIICFLKETPNGNCLSDTGIIHELVHLLTPDPINDLEEIRAKFKTDLKLA